MKRRCYNESCHAYDRYGGKSVTVCDEWFHSKKVFVDWALKNGWRKGLYLDRVRNEGGYNPDNCRFVTPKVSVNNRGNTVYLTAYGETKSLSDWVDDPRCKVSRMTLWSRVVRDKWSSTEVAISRHSNRRHSQPSTQENKP